MDEGFKDRVNKVFASISSSSSSWCVSNAQVEERREWKNFSYNNNNNNNNEIPVSSFSNLQDQQEDDDNNNNNNNNNNWEDIRSSIGLDSTLDNEEEEDAYDQMAQGSWEINNNDAVNHHHHVHNVNHHPAKTNDDAAIKSILKRKTCHEDVAAAKPAKRVRFDSTCKDKDDAAAAARPDPTRVSGNGRAVPDYILNPSKYTRYTLDDSQEDYLETSPKHATEKLCHELLPKSLVFIPRKKSGGNSNINVKLSSTQNVSIGIAYVEGEEMKEDDDDDAVCTKAKCQKLLRQYRSKMEDYDDDDDVS